MRICRAQIHAVEEKQSMIRTDLTYTDAQSDDDMMKMILLILLFSFSAFAETKNSNEGRFSLFQSVSVSLNSFSSDSNLHTNDKESIFTLSPNVSNGTGVAFETKFLNFSFIFSGEGDCRYKNEPTSQYRDIRLYFHWSHFDLRLNYQNYQGAVVNANERTQFYSDYRMRSKNMRAHYYFNHTHLDYIREGLNLVQKVSSNEALHFSSSFFLGLTADERSFSLPKHLVPEHQTIVQSHNFKYDTSFSAFTSGPLAGFDGMAFWKNIFARFKFGVGTGFQTGGYPVSQYEMALNLGFTIKKNHLISLNQDIYSISFKDSDQQIQNTNSQAFLAYTYVF